MRLLQLLILFIIFLLGCFYFGFANAQVIDDALYSSDPHCAIIRNKSDRTMKVVIRSDYYKRPDGSKDRYQTLLSLKKGEFQEICSKGPFYPDYKTALTISGMIPLFECQTKLSGEIGLHADLKEDGTHNIYADCQE